MWPPFSSSLDLEVTSLLPTPVLVQGFNQLVCAQERGKVGVEISQLVY